MNRRVMLKALAATGIGSATLHRAIVAIQEESNELTADTIKQAEWVSDIELSDSEREEIVGRIKQTNTQHRSLREIELGPNDPPAMHFMPLAEPQHNVQIRRGLGPIENAVGERPENEDDIAFLPVVELSGLIRTGKLTSVELTKIYLKRLKKYGPMLRCVVNLTEELAMKQAKRADAEIAAGRYRGPLHGIPWGAKDLISVPGYPTTWGIPHYRDRVLDDEATVARRLEDAGAVLVAKLSLGALAMGDKWFEGMTRNPWRPTVGSSGSSAGSASSVVAGLVGFTLGSETLGSILSPSTRCGASGMRPTFGRVSRHGCMPLSWSMDKIGPICRSVEDCALVFAAIHGADGQDPTANDRSFDWPKRVRLEGLKVGIVKGRKPIEERDDLAPLRELGCELIEAKLPMDLPPYPLANIISVEGASVFDGLLREGHVEGWNSWPTTFRAAQFVSAVDYLRYQRLRTKLMREFESFMSQFDLLFNMRDLIHTNLTGHPSVVLPIGFRERGRMYEAQTAVFTGPLNADDTVLAVAHAYQSKVDTHLKRPPLDDYLAKFEDGTLDQRADKSKADKNEEGKKASDQKSEPKSEGKTNGG